MNVITDTKYIDHPLDNVFDIVPSSTLVEYKTIEIDQVVDMPNYDAKDNEIETKLEEIYSVAMSNVANIADEMDRVEGKYKARVGEVTATMLNVALGAINAKTQLKMHKDKLSVSVVGANTPHTVNNNLVVTDRNEILRMLQNKS